jgi:tetratricopeptide (TPR) repeat protein
MIDGHALRRQGDLTGAVTAFAAAADTHRSRDDLGPLVDALCDSADTLILLGDPRAAAGRATEAVDVLRRQAMLGAGAVPSPQAARALLVLGTAEFRAGDAATGNLDAAVEMARRVTTALPTDPNQDLLAMALNHQSMLAQAAGRLDDAAAAAGETVAIRRKLAANDPTRFDASLASSLNTLAAAQGNQGDLPAATSSAMEACRVLRRLMEAGDRRAAINLAASESNAAVNLAQLVDELDLAVQFATSAVEGYLRLTHDHPPPAFVAELAKAMVVLAKCLGGQHDFDAAAQLCATAIRVLVDDAGLLPVHARVFIATAVEHCRTFAALSGAEVDPDLLAAASDALAGGND